MENIEKTLKKGRGYINAYDMAVIDVKSTQADKDRYVNIIRSFIEDIPDGVVFTPGKHGLFSD